MGGKGKGEDKGGGWGYTVPVNKLIVGVFSSKGETIYEFGEDKCRHSIDVCVSCDYVCVACDHTSKRLDGGEG